MPRATLDHQIKQIQEEILLLGRMVQNAMLSAMEAFRDQNREKARQVMLDDQYINDKRFAIENAILILIATQQPIAHDLRLLTAMLEVSTELERMGDYAKGIGKVVIRLGKAIIPVPYQDLTRMASLANKMLEKALIAFIEENANAARQIPNEDDAVDELYNKVNRFVVEAMISNPSIIDQANLLMWVAHNIERMADRVTNICERTIFISTGALLEMDTSDDEMEVV